MKLISQSKTTLSVQSTVGHIHGIKEAHLKDDFGFHTSACKAHAANVLLFFSMTEKEGMWMTLIIRASDKMSPSPEFIKLEARPSG